MAQPSPYTRQYDFTGWSASHPSDPHSGVHIDAELNAIKTTLDGALTNLAVIQRDDGGLASGTVTLTTLGTDVAAMLASASGWTPRGAWASTTDYVVGDVVTSNDLTYVCATAHTASGGFAGDLAAGYWVALLAPTPVLTISDGSVTTVKLANGSVTEAKLGFTSLALTGALSGATLAAGTLTPGTYLVGAKNDTGDAVMSIGRNDRTQGEVVVRIDGGTSGKVWNVRMDVNSDALKIVNDSDSLVVASFGSDGQTDVNATFRVTSAVTPLEGVGLEFYYSSSTGYVQSYDRDATAYKALALRGSTVTIAPDGTAVVTVSSTGAALTEGTVNGQPIGYRGLPQNAKTAAYQLVAADAGKHISITTGGVTIPANATVAFPIGTAISIFNDSGSSQTIAITSDTLRMAGTTSTGSRTLAGYGFATIIKVASTVWVISGAGLS